jgi:hypothetical protein
MTTVGNYSISEYEIFEMLYWILGVQYVQLAQVPKIASKDRNTGNDKPVFSRLEAFE